MLQMASSESDGLILVDKFGGENFNLYKFKLEMAMSTKDLWEIVEGSELAPPSTASDDILEHINKVKSLADQLTCLEMPMKDDDVVMTLLDSLPPSFEHLITALETRPRKELTLNFITVCLMHEVSKRKEKEPQGDDAAMLSRQSRAFDNNERHANTPRCYNCGKLGHIARNCRSQCKVFANIARSSDDFAFVMRDGASNTPATRWIVDSGESQHMTLHKTLY